MPESRIQSVPRDSTVAEIGAPAAAPQATPKHFTVTINKRVAGGLALATVLLVSALGVASVASSAKGPDGWDFVESDFSDTMTMTAVVNVDGEAMTGCPTCLLGAFVDGKARGVAEVTTPPFGPYKGKSMFQMTIYANSGGAVVTFKYYDGEDVTSLDSTKTFTVNANLGSVLAPITLDGTAPPAGPPVPTPQEPVPVQPPVPAAWEVVPSDFEASETMVATVKTGGATSGQTGTLAAMIDGEVRGVAECGPVPAFFKPDGSQCMITIYGNIADAADGSGPVTGVVGSEGKKVTFEFDDGSGPVIKVGSPDGPIFWVPESILGDNLAPVPLDDTAAATDDAPTDAPLACADEDEGPLWDQTVDAAANAGLKDATCATLKPFCFNQQYGPLITPVCKETCGLCPEPVAPEPVAPEPVAPEPACVDEDTTGNTAWEELKTTAESVGVKADSCADLAKYCDNAKYGAMIGAVCHASCGTCR